MAGQTIHWEFGDEQSSDEWNPTHIYHMAGSYDWSVEIADEDGNVHTDSGTIHVYDWAPLSASRSLWIARTGALPDDVPIDGLNVSITDECLRYSLKNSQGYGWAEFGGDDFPFPESRVGTLKVLDSVARERLLVLDAATGRIFEVGCRDIFLDAIGEYISGTEISTEILMKEEVGDPEHYYRKSLEHHIYFRPQDEDNQGATGYTEQGYRDGFEVTFSLRKDGQTRDRLTTRDIPVKGDLVFKHDEDAHRWQPRIRTNASEFKIVGVDNYYRALDQIARIDDRTMSESNYEQLLANAAVHLSRYSLESSIWQSNGTLSALQNRATGNNFTGTYTGFVTGPDGKTASGISFTGGGLTSASTISVSGNFAMTAWLRSGVTPLTIMGCGFTIRLLQESGVFRINFNGGGDSRTGNLSWDGTGWVLVTVQRDGNLLQMYEGSTLVFSQDVSNASFSAQCRICPAATVQVFNVKLLNNALTQRALDYYYDDVVNHEGKAICELF